MGNSLQYQAFELYCQDQIKAHPYASAKEGFPSALTFDNWIKTSAVIEEYVEKARQIRKEAEKFQLEKGWR